MINGRVGGSEVSCSADLGIVGLLDEWERLDLAGSGRSPWVCPGGVLGVPSEARRRPGASGLRAEGAP